LVLIALKIICSSYLSPSVKFWVYLDKHVSL